MKKIFALLLCAFTVTLVSCKSDQVADVDFRFDTPVVTDVEGTTAVVTCKVPTVEAIGTIPVSFAYGSELDDIGDYVPVQSPSVVGNTFTSRMTGLSPETHYKVVALLDMGSMSVRSEVASFTTKTVSPDETVLEITSNKTIVAAAAAGSYIINYEVTNPVPNSKVSAASEQNWVSGFNTTVDGSISFNVAANTGAERTAIINVSYPGATSRQVTVSQEASKSDPTPGDQVITTLTENGLPKAYSQNEKVKMGDFNYTLTSVADYGNGIQFKSAAGIFANADDMGKIVKIELTYTTKSENRAVALCLGDQPNPDANKMQAVSVNGTYTFDCSGASFHYFSLVNGSGASYLSEIKIYNGEGGGTPPTPDVKEPKFGVPGYSDLTKNSATISCSYTYDGDKTVSSAYFLYRTSAGTDQRADVAVGQGAKSASLTGLTAATLYSFRLCVVVDGKTYSSNSTTFVTNNEGGGPSADVKYTGWAELPANKEKAGDYYYAYHMRADAKSVRNFSVCYSKKFQCPVWVAAPMHQSYAGDSGRSGSYSQDPVLSGQGCSQTERREGYTRGHMLGSSDRTVSKPTNKQVFYTSNIGPQLQAGFNEGQGVWNNLEEQLVDRQWCSDTLYQVIGCYWANTNKVSSGTVIPTHYYKLLLRTKKGNSGKWVVNCTRDELKCVAFIVEHNSSQKGTKPNRNMMKSIAEMEAMTGFTFFPNVPNAPKDSFNAADWGL